MKTRLFSALLFLAPSFLTGSVASFGSDPVLAQMCSSTGSNPVEAASDCNTLGILDLRTGHSRGAEAAFRRALDLAVSALGESHPDVALYEANLALALGVQGQYSRAEVLLNRAYYLVDTTLSSGDPRRATVLAEMSAVETAQKRFPQAEADARKSLAIVSQRNAEDSLEVAVQQVVLATVYLRERKIDDAERILPDAVASERRLAAGSQLDRRVLAQAIRALGELRTLQHNWPEARTLYSEVIAIYESTSGGDHPALAPILLEYAEVLKHCGLPRSEVKSIEARARAIRMEKA